MNTLWEAGGSSTIVFVVHHECVCTTYHTCVYHTHMNVHTGSTCTEVVCTLINVQYLYYHTHRVQHSNSNFFNIQGNVIRYRVVHVHVKMLYKSLLMFENCS